MSAYVWMGDDAVRVDDEEGLVTVDGHVIPAATDCLTCHGRTTSDGVLPAPAAFTPFMLDHDGAGLGLARLIASGRYLGEAPASLPSSLTDVETEAVGYLAINCGTCHRDDGAAAFTPLRLDIDPATGAPHVYEAVGKAASWGQPSLLIAAGSPEKSQVYARMRSDDGMRMPMFAPSAHDEAGIALVASFIAGLDTAIVPMNTGAAR